MRYQSTVSGDTSQWIAGKVMSAARMARDESESQERDREAGLNVANSGNLFGKALVSEFGGDFFARTIGTLNPNSDARKTDRAASKASRFAANFPRTKNQTEEVEEEVKKSNEDVDRAVDDLLANDDHIPVKDEKLREYVARVFGGGIDAKLALVDQRVSKSLNLLSDIRTSHQHSIDLMIDHNELIAGKLDKVLNLYQQQYNFQTILKDKAQAAKTENQLELKRDLSRTKRYTGFGTGTESAGWLFGALSDIVGKKITNAILRKLGIKKPNKLLSPTKALGRLKKWKYLKLIFGRSERALVRNIKRRTVLGLAKKYPGVDSKVWTRTVKEGVKAVSRAGMTPDSIPQQIAAADRAAADIKAEFGEDINPRQTTKGKVKKPKVKKPKIKGFNASKKALKLSSGGRKAAKKFATKAGTKAIAKSAKLIPGPGTVIALGEAAYRASQGDYTGAALSALSAIPVLGWGVTAVDIARDMGVNPLGLPPPPDGSTDSSGGRIDQFEQGNPYGLTRRGDSMMHGTEMIQAVDPKSGMTTSHIKNIGDTLVSTSIAMARDLRVDRDISNTVSSLPFAVRNIRYNTGIKTAPVKSRATAETYLERTDSLSQWAKEEFDKNRKKEEVEPEKKGDGGFQPLKMFGKWLQSFGGDGGHPNPTTITFTDRQGLDRSGEPGVDFSYGDYTKNYSLFDGTVVKTGHQSTNYGNVVIIRSTDPSNGKEFDALYAHFPDGGIKVKEGKKVRRGQYLGQVGFVSAPSGEPELQPNGAGRMSGYHTSVDFYEPDSTATYSNASFLTNLILNSEGLSPKRNDLLAGIEQKDYTFEKEMIKEHEGLRLDAYYDNKGNLTIGYGHLIDKDSPVYGLKEGDLITEEKANELFEMDFKHHLEAAMNLPGWAEASERQRAALIDLVFNMGPYFLDSFPSMKEALENGDFEEAARQLQFADPDNRPGVESKWMDDVGERRSDPILNLLRDNPIDYEASPHHNDIKDLQVNNNLQTEILSAINLMNDNRLHDDSKLFSQIEEDSNTLQIVMLNNTIVNKQTVKRNHNVVLSNNNSLEMFKLAKLVG
tara:strand:+ start:6951 stop:10130 length:3180 start_codon:yes stop_codon:yes gene_type:complete